jgi:hypothetical protein
MNKRIGLGLWVLLGLFGLGGCASTAPVPQPRIVAVVTQPRPDGHDRVVTEIVAYGAPDGTAEEEKADPDPPE